jgi:hypothetical protein
MLIVAIPAAVEHQSHETATDNDGKRAPSPRATQPWMLMTAVEFC